MRTPTASRMIPAISSIVASDRLGEPTTNHELFELLERAGWLTPELRTELAGMAGFRNILVHGYVSVDAAIVRDVLEHRLGDIESFVESIRRRLDGVSTA